MGKITYFSKKLIGGGSHCTEVFQGKFGLRNVAVKKVDFTRNSTEHASTERERFDKEIEIMIQLDDHENIIRYQYHEINEAHGFIAMELCRCNLTEWVKSPPKDIKITHWEIFYQCASGIAHIHRNKLIHCDIKPANILVSARGQIKISDFGISINFAHDATCKSFEHKCSSSRGWMAPEIITYETSKKQPVIFEIKL